MGTMLYALAHHPILIQVAEQVPGLEVAAFADDVTFLHHAAAASRANAIYKHEYSRQLCGELNDAKSNAFSFGVTEDDARAAGLAQDIPWGKGALPSGGVGDGGLVLYGAPIGTEAFEKAFIQSAVDEAAVAVRRLPLMERRQHRLIMIRQSLCKKIQHIQRLVPTHPYMDVLERFDRGLLTTVSGLTHGRGDFTSLAVQLVSLPAALGGMGVDSAVRRADATYYSSFHAAYTRLSRLVPAWVDATYDQDHPSFAAALGAGGRLRRAKGMEPLLKKLSMQDRPMRIQAKIMALVHMERYRTLERTLPDREMTILQASAAAPHLISVSASPDGSLQVADEVLATHLARRLCLTQLPTPSFTDAAKEAECRCPGCGQNHVGAHLDGALACYAGGNPGRLAWHDMWLRDLHAMALSCGWRATLEPRSVAVGSAIRCDLLLHGFTHTGGAAYIDVRTWVRTTPSEAAAEANFPGLRCDHLEAAKTKKHYPAIRANNPEDCFYALLIDEAGGVGPQGAEILELICKRAPCPVAMLTYWRRRLAVTAARRVHAIMHTQLRGYTKSVTAAPTPAPGEVATQTVHAADEDAAALWRAEAGQAREGEQDGDGRDEEPQEMEEGDDYHIWLRDPQAGFGVEADEAERDGDDGDVASEGLQGDDARAEDGCAEGARGEEMEGLQEGGRERVGCGGEGGRGGVGEWPAAADLPAAVHVLNDDDVDMSLPANSGLGV